MDKIFQEKFKDFTKVPDEKVWKSISNSLDQKKKSRRMVPLWWKLAGVAALIAIMFLIVQPFGEAGGSDVIISDRDQPESPAAIDNPAGNADDNTTNTEMDKGLSSSEGAAEVTSDDNETLVNEVGQPAKPESEHVPTHKSGSKGAETQITENVKRGVVGDREGKIHNQAGPVATQDGMAQVDNAGSLKDEAGNSDPGTFRSDPSNIAKDGERMAHEATAQKEEAGAAGKKSIFDEINEDGEEIVAASGNNRWSLGARVAPVYFSSIGEGSPIHPNFVTNSKSGNVNLSYGLSVSYEVAPKLSVRSGVNKVDYGYDTNDIRFTSSLAASTQVHLSNIDYALASKNLVVQSLSDSEGTSDIILNNAKEVAGPEPSQSGRMVQQFGYLEVPLELNYALLERKLGINLIGGVSSLFLLDNSVTLQSNSGVTQIGEANNINSINFSTNVGFGINYMLSQKIQVSVEPMFKYQLHTFADSSGDFQPFSVGVYSGLNFKF